MLKNRVIAAMIVAATPALAAGPAHADVGAANVAANPVVAPVVVASGVGSPVPVTEPNARAATRCWYVTWSREYRNIFRVRLFTYYQRLDWCANNGTITSKSRNRYGTVSFPGWEFKGHTGSQETGGVGRTYYRSWTQGRFCLAAYFSCVQNTYPWIDMTGYPNGTWSGSQGG